MGDFRESLDTLRLFNEKVDRLEATGLVKRYADSIPNVIMKFDDGPTFGRDKAPGVFSLTGTIQSQLEDFDQDEVDAFVLTFRMIIQKRDRVSVRNLAKIYESDWMPEEARDCFRHARDQVNDYLDNHAVTVTFGDFQISIREITYIMIYGGLAHTDDEKGPIFRAMMQGGASGMIWAEFLAALLRMMHYFRYFKQLNEAVITALENDPCLVGDID